MQVIQCKAMTQYTIYMTQYTISKTDSYINQERESKKVCDSDENMSAREIQRDK